MGTLSLTGAQEMNIGIRVHLVVFHSWPVTPQNEVVTWCFTPSQPVRLYQGKIKRPAGLKPYPLAWDMLYHYPHTAGPPCVYQLRSCCFSMKRTGEVSHEFSSQFLQSLFDYYSGVENLSWGNC